MKPQMTLLLAFVLASLCGLAQEKFKVKFGKIAPEDFSKTRYEIDSSAAAVVIADIGSTEIEPNSKGGFSLVFKRFRRAHILNKNGYDIANVQIGIYANGDQEENLESLKAYTYNLENGKVEETRLNTKEAVFKDKISKRLLVKKFTFPNIKEGSIVEYEYTLKSDFIFNLQPWEFQGEYPRLWSEYNVSIPEFYYYVTFMQGYHEFAFQDRKDRMANFVMMDKNSAGATERYNISASVSDFRWVMKNIPALKEESYTSTLKNHLARIEFQLAELRHPFTPKNVMGTWPQVCTELMKDDDFGSALKKDNGWLSDAVNEAVGKADNDLQKAKNIFSYLQNRMTCTGYSGTYLQKSLKNVLKENNGKAAEINLLLTAMLIKAGFSVDPVILSTKQHGYTYALYPLLDRFNYVIARLSIGDKVYFLDASRPLMGFGRLNYDIYNGHARVVDELATPVDFSANSLLENKITSILILNDSSNKQKGSVQQVPGYFESYRLRQKIKEKGQAAYIEDLKKAFGTEVEIANARIDSLDLYEAPVYINYELKINSDNEDIIYYNPMLGEAWKENPFKSAERFYPVEMPYTIDETYLLTMDVPQGYTIDEMPKPIKVKLNEQEEGLFEYLISASEGVVLLRSRLLLKKASFMPEEYELLREFFNLVVKKHSEQIVFKKKN